MESIKSFEIKKVQKIVESKETEALLECLATLELHAESIGEGGNAEVFALGAGPFSKVCLKKVKEKQQIIEAFDAGSKQIHGERITNLYGHNYFNEAFKKN